MNRRSPLHSADWSRTHGFFAAMGGFTDGTKQLSLEDIEKLVQNKEIGYPIVTREEIHDKSKGDAVTTALVFLQTTWFLLQCAARARQHLALTELELMTAAFAVINIIIYALLWDKPLDVHCHIAVRSKSTRDAGAREASPLQNPEERPPEEKSGVPPRQEQDCWARSLGWLIDAWDGLRSVFRGWAWNRVEDGLIMPFLDMLRGDDSGDTFFVVGRPGELDVSVVSGLILVTMVCGGIHNHCIAWSFTFPSPTEQLLWRVSSIVITGIPLAVLCFGYIRDQLLDFDNPARSILFITISLLYFLYLVSRILLLVLSLSTLRSLPPSAYQTVQWTTFLPHI